MILLRRSPKAERDLQDLWLNIAVQSERAATKVLRDLDRRISRLASHPRLGPRRHDIGPSVRLLVEGNILILYETIPDTDDGAVEFVDIIRVVDGRRDLQTVF